MHVQVAGWQEAYEAYAAHNTQQASSHVGPSGVSAPLVALSLQQRRGARYTFPGRQLSASARHAGGGGNGGSDEDSPPASPPRGGGGGAHADSSTPLPGVGGAQAHAFIGLWRSQPPAGDAMPCGLSEQAGARMALGNSNALMQSDQSINRSDPSLAGAEDGGSALGGKRHASAHNSAGLQTDFLDPWRTSNLHPSDFRDGLLETPGMRESLLGSHPHSGYFRGSSQHMSSRSATSSRVTKSSRHTHTSAATSDLHGAGSEANTPTPPPGAGPAVQWARAVQQRQQQQQQQQQAAAPPTGGAAPAARTALGGGPATASPAWPSNDSTSGASSATAAAPLSSTGWAGGAAARPPPPPSPRAPHGADASPSPGQRAVEPSSSSEEHAQLLTQSDASASRLPALADHAEAGSSSGGAARPGGSPAKPGKPGLLGLIFPSLSPSGKNQQQHESVAQQSSSFTVPHNHRGVTDSGAPAPVRPSLRSFTSGISLPRALLPYPPAGGGDGAAQAVAPGDADGSGGQLQSGSVSSHANAGAGAALASTVSRGLVATTSYASHAEHGAVYAEGGARAGQGDGGGFTVHTNCLASMASGESQASSQQLVARPAADGGSGGGSKRGSQGSLGSSAPIGKRAASVQNLKALFKAAVKGFGLRSSGHSSGRGSGAAAAAAALAQAGQRTASTTSAVAGAGARVREALMARGVSFSGGHVERLARGDEGGGMSPKRHTTHGRTPLAAGTADGQQAPESGGAQGSGRKRLLSALLPLSGGGKSGSGRHAATAAARLSPGGAASEAGAPGLASQASSLHERESGATSNADDRRSSRSRLSNLFGKQRTRAMSMMEISELPPSGEHSGEDTEELSSGLKGAYSSTGGSVRHLGARSASGHSELMSSTGVPRFRLTAHGTLEPAGVQSLQSSASHKTAASGVSRQPSYAKRSSAGSGHLARLQTASVSGRISQAHSHGNAALSKSPSAASYAPSGASHTRTSQQQQDGAVAAAAASGGPSGRQPRGASVTFVDAQPAAAGRTAGAFPPQHKPAPAPAPLPLPLPLPQPPQQLDAATAPGSDPLTAQNLAAHTAMHSPNGQQGGTATASPPAVASQATSSTTPAASSTPSPAPGAQHGAAGTAAAATERMNISDGAPGTSSVRTAAPPSQLGGSSGAGAAGAPARAHSAAAGLPQSGGPPSRIPSSLPPAAGRVASQASDVPVGRGSVAGSETSVASVADAAGPTTSTSSATAKSKSATKTAVKWIKKKLAG